MDGHCKLLRVAVKWNKQYYLKPFISIKLPTVCYKLWQSHDAGAKV